MEIQILTDYAAAAPGNQPSVHHSVARMVFAVAIGLSHGIRQCNPFVFEECPKAATAAVGNLHPRTELIIQGLAISSDPSRLIKPKTVINLSEISS